MSTSACSGARHSVVRGMTMGTTYMVQCSSGADLRGPVETRLSEIDALLSTYRADSEISRFNDSQSTDWTGVSRELLTVLTQASRAYELTGGAFDVTIGPALKAWGFAAGAERGAPPPSQTEVDALRQRTGFHLVQVDPERQALRKLKASVRLDVSALGEGFAVDELAAILERSACVSYLVEIGGDIRVKGANSQGGAWAIAVETPSLAGRSPATTLRLSLGSIATSGVYRNFVGSDAERRSHVLDARTLRPVQHDLVSATVIARSCLSADALATALLITGRAEAQRLSRQHNIASLLIYGKEGDFRTEQSPAWRSAVLAGGVRD